MTLGGSDELFSFRLIISHFYDFVNHFFVI